MFGGLSDKISGTFDKIISYPDSFSNPVKRKAMYIVYDVALITSLITLGFLALSVMVGGLHNPFSLQNFIAIGHGLQDGGLSAIMGVGVGVGLTGFGLSYLFEHIFPNKVNRTIGKVLLVVAPLTMLAGATLLITGGGFHHLANGKLAFDFSSSATTTAYTLGVLIFPTTLYLTYRALKVLTRKEVPFFRGPPPKLHKDEEIRKQEKQDEEKKLQDIEMESLESWRSSESRRSSEEDLIHSMEERSSESEGRSGSDSE